mgnify:CR=1 FL=1
MPLSFGPNALHRLSRLSPVLFGLVNSRLRGVVLRVLYWIDDKQVLNRVVRPVMVKMVNVFLRAQRAANVLLHHVAVLQDVTPVLHGVRMFGHSQHHIALTVDVAALTALHAGAVVAVDELPNSALIDGGLLATSAGAHLRLLKGSPFVMVRQVLAALVVARIRRYRQCPSTAASALLRAPMAAKHVWLAVTKQGVSGDCLPATTRTNDVVSHSYQYSSILG